MSCRLLLRRPFITGPQLMCLNLGAQVGIATAGMSMDLLSIHAPAIFKLPMVNGTFAIKCESKLLRRSASPVVERYSPFGAGHSLGLLLLTLWFAPWRFCLFRGW